MKLLMNEKGKKFLVKEDDDFHTDMGILKKNDIISSKEGDIIKTHLDREFKVIKPNINDYIDFMKRRCSILLPKDIGNVIAYTGVGYGSKILDSGTGAASIALHFGNIVGDKGMVYSYEIREDFAEIAIENIENFGLKNIQVKNKDIKEGIDENNLDLVFLDLPKPYEIFEDVYSSLKYGGFLVVYAPYIEQVQISVRISKKVGFKEIIALETIQREIEVKDKGTRPKTRMAGHTGYLIFARKI